MSPLFKIYLANIPFIDKNFIITNGNYNIDSLVNYDYEIEVDNLNIIDDTTISFIALLKDIQFTNLLFNQYNAIYVTNSGNSARLYRITSINYTSACRVRIVGKEVFYNIIKDKLNASFTNNYSNLKSHETFVKYGYAYDSILTSTGRPNFSSTMNTDLYTPLRYEVNCNLELSKTTLFPNITITNPTDTSATEDEIKLWLNNYCYYWIFVYLQPGSYKLNDIEFTLGASIYNGLVLPYGIIAVPLCRDNYKIFLDNTEIYIDWLSEVLSEIDQNRIYNIKLYPYPPSVIYNDCKIVDNNLYITTMNNCALIEKVFTNTINVVTVHDTYDTDISLASISNIPKLCNPNYTFTAEDLATFDNPYVAGNTNKLYLTDYCGNEKEISLLGLGEIGTIRFNINMPAILESTTYNVDLEIENINAYKSFYQYIPYKEQNYLVGNFNYGLSYSVDQLNSFLGSNKNWYKMQLIAQGGKFVDNHLKMINASAGEALSGKLPTSLSTINVARNIIGLGNSIWKNNLYIDNLKNAPDKIITTSGDFSTLFSFIYPFRICLSLRTCSDIIKKLVLDDFVYRGLYLNKYVDDGAKYFNITNNKFDKKYLKYFEGNCELYLNIPTQSQTLEKYIDYNKVNNINSMFNEGVKLINYTKNNDNLNSNSWNENNIMINIDERSFNE